MLQPMPYPSSARPLKKLENLQDQSKWMGDEGKFSRVPVTTFFEDDQNNVGVPMCTNTGSGHECTGLNDGSKNSVATTYLADAWNWGAEIFCGCEVRFVEKVENGDGYIVFFSWHGAGRDEFKDEFSHQLYWVKAVSACCTNSNF
jgi:hypothetical protein